MIILATTLMLSLSVVTYKMKLLLSLVGDNIVHAIVTAGMTIQFDCRGNKMTVRILYDNLHVHSN